MSKLLDSELLDTQCLNMQNSQGHKRDLRQSLLQQRQSLTTAQWQSRSQQLAEQLRESAHLQQALTVLAYISTRQEPDLSLLFELPHLTWGLPRCQGDMLVWHRWLPPTVTALVQGKYGIWEPRPELPQLQPAEIDLILVPAVACDAQGYRLGYGGGYYDRLLSQPEWQNIPTIGIVFEFAYLPEVPRQDWDRPLQAVCTEEGLRSLV
jgi:5-formyltetrahydrofolate cyclo-ligase